MFVITGGSGFIGSVLAKRLIGTGKEIKVLDIREPKFEVSFSKSDITDYNSLKNEISKGDVVIHLAALTNAHESDRKLKEYFDVNVAGTFNVVRACKEAGAKKIVFASSIAVIDPELTGEIDETARRKPQNFYGVTKVIGEELVKGSGIDHAILRFTNVYGPGGKGVINIFVEKLRNGEPLEVWGTGEQERDFIHVDDVTDALIKATKKGHGIYDIAYGKNHSVNEVTKMITALSGSKFEVVHREKNEIPLRYRVSNSKARAELGWEPRVSLEEGIEGLLA